jgi:hypothetical protein
MSKHSDGNSLGTLCLFDIRSMPFAVIVFPGTGVMISKIFSTTKNGEKNAFLTQICAI